MIVRILSIFYYKYKHFDILCHSSIFFSLSPVISVTVERSRRILISPLARALWAGDRGERRGEMTSGGHQKISTIKFEKFENAPLTTYTIDHTCSTPLSLIVRRARRVLLRISKD
jgi:hypothetical protein